MKEEFDYLEYCIDRGDMLSNQVDYDEIVRLYDVSKHFIKIPEDYGSHSVEDMYDECDFDSLPWVLPDKEFLKYAYGYIFIDVLYSKSGYSFWGVEFEYDESNESVIVNLDEFIEAEKEYNRLKEEYEYDINNVLPTKPYVGNCSKEFCEKIVEKFWEREYDKIQSIYFPPQEFDIPTPEKCKNEMKRLLKDPGTFSAKGRSNIIKYFHRSMIHANVGKMLSPFDGWKLVQSDPEMFKDFYRNRLRCSDWFKGKTEYLLNGWVMENTYGIGLSTSRKYQSVTYFKPKLAKYLVEKYLSEYNTVFDPFSGYSGRMLGALGAHKNYIGRDLCEDSVRESNEIYNFIKDMLDENQTCDIQIGDACKNHGEYECLLTCSPYGNIEQWPGVKSVNYDCDKWIDICLSNYKCNKYVFVTDGNIVKYKPFVKETITNTSHFSPNDEYVVVIDKEDLKKIHLKPEADRIELPEGTPRIYSDIGIDLYNIFNPQYFDRCIDAPLCMKKWIKLIYDKFNQPLYEIREVEMPSIELKTCSNTVLLACSGGLDSTYQILELKDMGYDVVLYHAYNINTYEHGNAYKGLVENAKKLGCELITCRFSRALNSCYSKHWPENPIKNQLMLLSMIDICHNRGWNKIAMDGSWEFSIDEVTAGIDVADAPENYEYFFECINPYVKNLEFIKTSHEISKLDKIKRLDNEGLMDNVYSCLTNGAYNQYRHNIAEEKYNIKLFKNNCGHSCRKCAHHNLLLYYSGIRQYPEEFIDRCWHIMNNNNFNSRNMLFGDDVPLEQKIKNLFVE